jgi:hypothetical protein
MGIDPVSLGVMGGGALLSGAAGAIKGGKGTPEQATTTKTTIAGPGQAEQDLQAKSLYQYEQAQNLANQYEGQIGSAQSLQDQARQAASRVIGGEAFNITPQEQAQIEAIRSATVNAGTGDIQDFLNRQMSSVVASGGGRGLRGQALGSLQGQVIDTGARQLGNLASQAQLTAAQQAFQAPYQRLGAQSPYIQGGMSFADQMRLQAQNNRNLLQSPWMLQAYQRERMAQPTVEGITPGQPGGFGNALIGGLGGAVGGANIGGNVLRGFASMKSAPSVGGSGAVVNSGSNDYLSKMFDNPDWMIG